ncbi:MAG TPA: hypothetical protein VFG21_05445 [Xanthomonadaceae bacterium]|nr:hypothetical protein [Xanthomonadaceae bacterium]
MSGAALALEVLLVRLLAIVQHHVFAPAVISLALLGVGASGTALALVYRGARRPGPRLLAASALAFAVAVPLCWALAQQVPFNGLALVWDLHQLPWLALLYLLLALPFLSGSLFVGAAFLAHARSIERLYLADLLGAGAGAAVAIAMLYLVPAPWVLWPIAAAGLAAGAMVQPHRGWSLAVLAAAAVAASGWPTLRPDPYKPLSQMMQTLDARLVETVDSPRARLSVVASPTVPVRHAPGLSLRAGALPPQQLAVFIDGEAMTAIDQGAQWQYLDDSLDALVLLGAAGERVAVVGETGGRYLALAARAGVAEIQVLQPDRNWRVLGGRHGTEVEARWHAGPVRPVLAAMPRQDRLLLVADAPGRATLGDYAFTREAFAQYLRQARRVAVVTDVSLPPRGALRLLATAIESLQAQGVEDPRAHLLALRDWRRLVFVVSLQPVEAGEVEAARAFADRLAFDPVWLPGLERAQANQRNAWPEPYLYDAVAALAAGDTGLYRRWKFDVRPTRDDRPRFDNFFRWRLLSELAGSRQHGALLLESSLLVQSATLVVASAGAIVLLLPAAWAVRRAGARRVAAAALYFASLGLGFLLLEIAFLEKLALLLGDRLVAVAFALAAFLVFAGLGAGFGARVLGGNPVARAVLAICALLAIDVALLESIGPAVMATAGPLRWAFALVLTAPLAFAMGVPFPAGIRALADARDPLVAWAWAVNGAFSVLAGVLAGLLVLVAGFRLALVCAAACYLVVPFALRRLHSP